MAVRICPGCGEVNHELATVCGRCREMLLGVAATEPEAPPVACGREAADNNDEKPAMAAAPVLILEGPAGSGFSARITEPAVVGRGADIDVTALDPDEFISRRHLRISHRAGRWWAEHLSEVNPTTLAAAPLKRGQPIALEDGDRLTLAKTEFLVRIGP